MQALRTRLDRPRAVARLLLALAFLIAGVLHIRSPHTFLAITPAWVPDPPDVIFVTGICEILGAVALLIPRLRRLAGVMLALYSVCVFPANIHHALAHVALNNHPPLGWGYHAPRLAMQPVIIWWCLFAGGLIDWPFRRAAPRVA